MYYSFLLTPLLLAILLWSTVSKAEGHASVADIAQPLNIPISELLNRIIVANRHYSYEGLLTYEANGSLSTLRLNHHIDRSGQYDRVFQRLEFLDGASRHVLREQQLKACSNGGTRWGLWSSTLDMNVLEQFYNVQLEGYERVAERKTLLLHFSPKDNLRYGYRFNVDPQTGLLLRSIVLEKNDIVERTQFVSLSLIEGAPLHRSGKEGGSWRVPEVDPCHTEQFKSAWYVDWLPAGFESAGNRITAQGEQVLMFTDGLVSISVFITSNNDVYTPKITARRGATVAVISSLPIHSSNNVAVVGEIPAITARRIAVSVRSRR